MTEQSYGREQDRIFQEMQDQEAAAMRAEQTRRLSAFAGALDGDQRKLLDDFLRVSKSLAKLKGTTEVERQAIYDQEVAKLLEQCVAPTVPVDRSDD